MWKGVEMAIWTIWITSYFTKKFVETWWVGNLLQKNCKFERHSKHMRALNTLVIRRPQSVRFLRYSKTIQFAIYIEVEEQKEDRHEMNASKVDGGGRTDSC